MTPDSIGGRAVVAVGLLLGFYVLAAAVLVALVGVNAAMVAYTGRLYWAVVVFTLLTAIALARGVFSILSRDEETADGVAVTRTEEPRLWALVDEVAGAMGTRRPDELRVVHDVNAAVAERGGLLGLRRGRRDMLVGLGLVQVLDVDELRAVLAHELGHYARGDTRLGPLNYRAGASVWRTVEHLGSGTLLGRLFASYAMLFLRVSLAVRRRQELGADAAAARIGGPRAHASALRTVNAAGAAYGFFLDRYVAPLWSRGAAPDDLYDGFRRLWTDPGRRDELAAVVEAAEAADPHPLDSHPSLRERLASIDTLAAGGAGASRRDQAPPARSLLSHPEALERRVTRALSEQATGGPVARPIPWAEVADRVYRQDCLDTARWVLNAVGRVDGRAGAADPARLLSVLETDAVVRLAVELAGDVPGATAEERAEYQASVLTDAVATALGAALVEAGQARWQLSWSGPLEVVAGGEPLDLRAAVTTAADEPGRVPELREWLLLAGLDPAWTPPPAAPHPERDQELVGVLANLRHAGRRADALLLTDELVLARTRATAWERASTVMAASVGMTRGDATSQRIHRLLEGSLDEIVAGDPGNRRIPWSAVRTAHVRRRLLLTWRLQLRLDSGEVVTVDPVSGGPTRKDTAETLRLVLADRVTA